jgi:hypothetical protein
MWHAWEFVNLLNLELRFKETQVVDISTMQSIEKVCDISALQCFENCFNLQFLALVFQRTSVCDISASQSIEKCENSQHLEWYGGVRHLSVAER